MPISLVRNTAKNHDSVPYLMRLDLSTEVIEPNTVFHVPVHLQRQAGQGIVKDIYSAEICGFRIEAGNLQNVVRLAERLVPGLINLARLPTYIFVARRSRRIYPVYTVGDEVFATTPGGPMFRHVELAKVREYLSEYLHAVGELGAPGKSETLHVRGVNTETLALVRPVFYLKKRVPGENEFWAPVFPSDDGQTIYTYAASAKREVPVTDGHEVLALRDVVAEALIADRRLRHPFDLRVDRLLPDYWARLQGALKPQPQQLLAGSSGGAALALPIFRNAQVLLAAEERSDEGRWGLFVGASVEDLRNRVGQDLYRRGLIPGPEAVRVTTVHAAHSLRRAPATLLDQVLYGRS